MNQDDTHIVVRGTKMTVEYGVLDDGSVPSQEFLEGLDEEDQAYLFETFRFISDNGVSGFRDDRRFKQERDFWAAKKDKCKRGPKGREMVRIVCYRTRNKATGGERLVLTHGFWKPPKPKWKEKQFTCAQKIRDEIDTREQRE